MTDEKNYFKSESASRVSSLQCFCCGAEIKGEVFVLQKKIAQGDGFVDEKSDPDPHYFCSSECVIDYLNGNCPEQDIKAEKDDSTET